MEEETRRLKELLEKNDAELQNARLLGAEMASQLLSFKDKQELSYEGPSTRAFIHSSNDLVNSSYGSDSSSLITDLRYSQMTSMFQHTELKETNLISSKLDNGEFSSVHIDQAQFDMLSNPEQRNDFSDAGTGNSSMHGTLAIDIVPRLTSTIAKLLETIKDLMSLSCIANMQDVPCVFWTSPDFHVRMRAFMKLCAASLHEKMDITKFTNDLSSLVEELGRVNVSNGEKRLINYETISPDNTQENLSGDNNMNQKKVMIDSQDLTRMQEELRKIQDEKVALETHMKVEFQRLHGVEQDLVKILGEKLDLEKKLQVAYAELGQLKAKIFRLEQNESNLWDEFMSAKSSKQFIDKQLSGISSFTDESESQLKIIVVEWSRLQYRVDVLESEIRDKKHKNALLEAKCQRLKDQLLRSSIVCSKCQSIDIDEEAAVKDFATKGTKRWQAKLELGKQFKALSLRKGQTKEYSGCSQEEPVSIDRSSTPPEEKEQEQEQEQKDNKIGSLFKIHLKTVPTRFKRYQRAKKEVMDSHRYGSAADILDWELTSLSTSGRPLCEFFGSQTPEHDHYIQVVEEIPSSSDEERLSPVSMESVIQSLEEQLPTKTRAKSMDTAINDKHHRSFSKSFFSRQRKPQA